MYIIYLYHGKRYWTSRGWSTSQRARAKRYTRYDARRIAASLGGANYVEVIAYV